MANDAPLLSLVPDDTANGNINTLSDLAGPDLTLQGTFSFTDADLKDQHAVAARFDAAASSTDRPQGLLTPVLATDATGGHTGQIAWSYAVDTRRLAFLAAGETLTEVFDVVVSDGHGGKLVTPVTILLTGTNSAPVIAYEDGDRRVGKVTETVGASASGATLTTAGTFSFKDADLTDTHAVSAQFDASASSTADALGSLTPTLATDANGGVKGKVGWTYTVAADALEALAAGQTLIEVFDVTVDDGHGGTLVTPLKIIVTGTNDVPLLSSLIGDTTSGSISTPSDAAGPDLQANGVFSFTDADLTDQHAVAARFDTAASSAGRPRGSLTPVLATDATGGHTGQVAWSYAVDRRRLAFLAAGETLTEVFDVVVSDGHGGKLVTPVTILLTGTNSAPVLAYDNGDGRVGKVTETVGAPASGATLTTAGTFSFKDADLTDVHSVSVQFDASASSTAEALGSVTPSLATDATGGVKGKVGWTYTVAADALEALAAGQALIEVFNVTVDDGRGSTLVTPLTVTLKGTNDVPLLAVVPGDTTSGDISVLSDAAGPKLTALGTFSFTDADLTDQHVVSVRFDAAASSTGKAVGSLRPVLAKDATGGHTGQVAWSYTVDPRQLTSLALGQTLTEVFDVIVKDGHGGKRVTPVTIHLSRGHQAPVVTEALANDTGTSAGDRITADAALKGTGDPNARVTVKEGGTVLGTVIADAGGAWSFVPTAIADGVHTIVASETDANGNTGSSAPLVFTLDTTAPSVTAALTNDSGTSASDKVTAKADLVGTGDPNALVTIKEGATVLGTVVVGTSGAWTFTPVGLVDGQHTIVASETDAAGNTGSSAPLTFNLDTATPLVTASLADDTGASDNDHITKSATLSGAADPSALVTIKEGTTVLGTVLAGLGGAWTFTPTGLADGSHVIIASETDAAGNTGSSAALGFTLDTTAPAIAVSLANDTGASSSDKITSDATLSGTGDPNAVVTIADGATVLGTTTAGASGTWTFTPTGLIDGRHTIVASETDAAGNMGSSTPLVFTLDTSTTTSPPPAPVFGLAAADQVRADQTRSSLVTLVGVTGAGDTVILSTGASTLADKNGKFQFTNVALALGDNALEAKAVDSAGRSSTFDLTINRAAATSGGNLALVWDKAALAAIQTAAFDPELGSRALAIESLAVYDAVSGIDGTPGYLVNIAAPAGASADAATAAAAHAVLAALFPRQQATFDALFASSLAGIADGQAKTDGIAYGKAVADRILALRAGDGWNTLVDDEGGTAVGQWRPTAPNYTPGEEPQWASLDTFAIASPDQFRAPAPPDLTSQAYADAVNKTLSLGASNSTKRTADETQIAKFWADGAGTVTPPGHWNDIAALIAQQKGDSLAQDARLFAELNVALADSAIAAWDTKYTYNTWRPITVAAEGNTIGNPGITAIPGWTPLINTPSHPEYVSGHSTFSEAAVQILNSIFGDNVSFTIGSTSLGGVTRSFTSFEQAAQEAGESRIYGGIHFEFSNQAGQVIGTDVGQWVLKAFDLSQDTVAPKIVLDQKSGFATNAAVKLTGSVTDNLSGVAQLQYKLDSGAATAVTFGSDGTFAIPLGLAVDGSADGVHTVQLIASDAAGNIASPVSLSFALDTIAPTFTLAAASVQDGGKLAADASVAGTVTTENGVTLTALSYRLDGSTVVPLAFDAAGGFSQALDLSRLAAGSHTLVLTARDSAGNTTTDTLHLSLPSLPPLTIQALTPMMGAGDIGVTYRPQITFSRAVDASTLTSSSFYATDSTGAKLAATIVPIDGGLGAYLFFTNPMPGASTITLHVDGSLIKAAADGALLDALGTGTPGSTMTETFTTVSTAPVPNTTITGIVLDPGADLTPMTPDDFKAGPNGPSDFAHDTFKLPIAHVKVYILGHEDEAVYTDADGKFTLTSVPTGDVKVVFDGRTATNAPSGLYFPEMTMDTTIRPGIVNTIMGSMGTAAQQAYNALNPSVYLPRVQNDVLQSVSDTAPTVVTVPQDAASGLTAEQASKLTLTVAPGSIVDANGNPIVGAKVGLSPVAPQIVMDMLPPGVMQHTFDITIQVPDGAAFTTPATLTLPNVFNAAPGTKLSVLSFDHTTGRLVIDGTGTVSADGLSVVTDPGSGITKPGWHGLTMPGRNLRLPQVFRPGERVRPNDSDLSPKGIGEKKDGLQALANYFDHLPGRSNLAGESLRHFLDGTGTDKYYGPDTLESQDVRDSKAFQDRLNYLTNKLGDRVAANLEGGEPTLGDYSGETGNIDFYKFGILPTDQLSAGIGGTSLPNEVRVTNIKYDQDGNFSADVQVVVRDEYSFWDDGGKSKYDDWAKQLEDGGLAKRFTNSIEIDSHVTGNISINKPHILLVNADKEEDLGGADEQKIHPIMDFIPQSQIFTYRVGDDDYYYDVDGYRYRPELAIRAEVYYLIEGEDGSEIRGAADPSVSNEVFLASNKSYQVDYFNPTDDTVASFIARTGSSPEALDINSAVMIKDTSLDGDHDGVSDFGEHVVGTNASLFSTLNNGISDGMRIKLELGGLSVRVLTTGVIASLLLQGEAQSVTIAGSLSVPDSKVAYVATGSYGLAIVDVSSFAAPRILSQLKLSGSTATDIAIDTTLNLAAVATGAGGLQIVNVADPSSPVLVQTVRVDATAVKVLDGIAYANDGAALDAIDLSTGELLQTLTLTGSSLTGMVLDGTTLYTMDSSNTLRLIDLSSGLMAEKGSISLPGGGNKIFVADGIAYVSAADGRNGGYLTVDVSDPAAPKLIEGVDALNVAGTALALNGSGLGVAVGALFTNTGLANVLDVLNTSDPTKTGQFITRYNLPGTPEDVAIGDGIAFVADGSGGLQVVNYKSFDTLGVAPTVTVTATPADIDPNAAGIQVVEGQTVSLKAKITDDVQVRNVELLVNGAVAVNDVGYPFDLSAILPTIAANGSDMVTLQVEAIDTGGNTTVSDAIKVQLVRDTVAPRVVSQTLADGGIVGQSFRSVSFTFSKSLDANAVTAADFTLTGPGGTVVAPTAFQLRGDDRTVQLTYATLPVGAYTLAIDAAGVLDRAGNALGTAPIDTQFTVLPFSEEWIAGSGSWTVGTNWSKGTVPGAQDDVLLDLPMGVVVTLGTYYGSTPATTVARLSQTGGGELDLYASLTVSETTSIAGTLKLLGSATLDAEGDASIQTLALGTTDLYSGGTLTGTGIVTLTGASTWFDGSMTGTGKTVVSTTGSIAIGGRSYYRGEALGRELDLAGAATLSNGYLYLGSYNSTLRAYQKGTLVVEAGGSLSIGDKGNIYDTSTDTGSLANAGALTKTDAGDATIATGLTNTGSIDVAAGTLILSGGGDSSGTIDIAIGATLEIRDGAFTIGKGASITDAGTLALSGGTFDIEDALTLPTIAVTGGTLTGSSDITVSGALAWSSGEMLGPAKTTVASTATLTLGDPGGSEQLGRELDLAGVGTMTHDVLYLGAYDSTKSAYVAGTLAIQATGSLAIDDNSSISDYGNNAGEITNAGTIEKTGAGTATFDAVLTNTGTVKVDTGILALTGGGTSAASGFSLAKGATLQFGGGTFVVTGGGTLGGAGLVALSGGTLATASALSLSTLSETGGTLSGSGNVTITAALAWSGGIMLGSGKTLVASTALLTLGDAGGSEQLGRELDLAGAGMMVHETLYLGAYDSAQSAYVAGTLAIQKTGSLTLDDRSLIGDYVSNAGAIVNAGTIAKTGAGTAAIVTSLTNTGMVKVNAGTLKLGGGGTSAASGFTIAQGATLAFAGGDFALDSGTFGGTGTVSLIGGTLSGSGNVTITAALAWSGGVMLGSGKTLVASTAILTLGDAGGSEQLGRELDLAGVGTMAHDTLYLDTYDSAKGVYVAGTLAIQKTGSLTLDDSSSIGGYYVNNAGIVTNAGTIEKIGALAATIDTTLTNTGTVKIDAGTLVLGGGGTSAASGFSLAKGTTLEFGGGNFAVIGGGTLGGTGLVSLTGGTLDTGSAASSVATLSEAGGTLQSSGNLTITTALAWSGGVMLGSGKTLVASAATLTLGDAGGSEQLGRELDLAGGGTMVHDTLYLGTYDGNGAYVAGALVIQATGSLMLDDSSSIGNYGGNAGTITNAGTIEKTGAFAATIDTTLTSTGTVKVDAGTLLLSGGGTSAAAGFVLAKGATLQFGGGDFALTRGTFGGTGTVALTGGTLGGSGDVVIAAALAWSGGAMLGSGTTTVASTAALTLASTVYLGRELDLAGAAQMSHGTLDLGAYDSTESAFAAGTLAIQASGSLAMDDGSSISDYGGGAGTITNAGVIEKTGAGTATIGAALTNTGTVKVDAGILALSGGGTSAASGFTLAQGAALQFNGGEFAVTGGGSLGGSGLIALTGGTLDLGGALSLASFSETGGTLVGSGNLAVTALFTWSGGDMLGTGKTTVASAATLAVGGTVGSEQLGRELDLAGVGTIVHATLHLGAYDDTQATYVAGTLAIQSTGSLTIDDGSAIDDYGGNAGTFINAGTIEKIDAGTASIGAALTNTGTIKVAAGTLALTSTVTGAGTIEIFSRSTLDIRGTVSADQTVRFTGAKSQLRLSDSDDFGAHIAGFQGSDVIVLSSFNASDVALSFSEDASKSFGTLKLSNASQTASITLAGQYTAADFEFGGDGQNGLAVALAATGQPVIKPVTTMSDGTLTADLTITTDYIWNGGVMAGPGTTTVKAGATLTFGGGTGGGEQLGRELDLAGVGTMSHNTLYMGAYDSAKGAYVAGTLAIQATGSLTIDDSSTISENGSDAGTIKNAGILEKIGAFTATIDTSLTNTGTVKVDAGTLALTDGGTSAASGFTLAEGTALQFGGGTFAVIGGGTLGGAGFVSLTGGTLDTGSAALTIVTFGETQGTLQGSGSLAITTAFDWSGGSMLGTGKTTVSKTAILTLAGAEFLGRELDLAGVGSLRDGTLYLGAYDSTPGAYLAGTLAVQATGSLTVDDGSSIGNYGSSAGIVVNAGLIEKTGALTASIDTTLTNSGTVKVDAGTLVLTGGGTSAASGFTVTRGATLQFGGGDFTLTGGTFGGTGSVLLTGGTLQGSGDSVIATALVWTGGTLGGTGKTRVASGATLTLGGAGGSEFLARELDLAGAGQMIHDTLYLGAYDSTQNDYVGGTLAIQATGALTIDDSSAIDNYGSGADAVTNAGTIEKTGTGIATIGVSLTNSGTVKIDAGTLALTGGGTSAASGFTLAQGTTLQFGGDAFSIAGGGTLGGAGAVALTGGTLDTGSAALSIATLGETGGTLQGSGSLAITAAFAWSGGTMSGTGKTIVTSTSTLTLGSRGSYAYLGRELDLAGVGTMLHDTLYLGTYDSTKNAYVAGTLAIQATGSLTIDDSSTIDNYGSGADAVTNAGTIEKTGAAIATIGAALINTGSVKVDAGTLALTGGGTSAASGFTLADGATLQFGGGDFALDSGTFGGAGTVSLTGGTLRGSGDIVIAAALAWSGGAMLGTGKTTVASTATLTLEDTGSEQLGRELDLAGAGNLRHDTLYLGAYDSTQNDYVAGTLAIQATGSLTIDDSSAINNYGSDAGTITNVGIIDKTGAGAATIGLTLTNTGTVKIDAGTLVLTGGGTSAASGFTLTQGTTLQFGGGAFSIAGGGTLGGAGEVSLTGGTLDTGSAALSIATLGESGGTLQGSGSLAITAAFAWSGGTMSGTGKMTVASTATLTLGGTGGYAYLGRELDLAGVGMMLHDTMYLGAYDGTKNAYIAGTLAIQATGRLTIDDSSTIAEYVSNGGSVANAGTIEKTGAATASINAGLVNTGTIDIDAGTLTLRQEVTNNGDIQVHGQSTLLTTQALAGTGSVKLLGDGDIEFDDASSNSVMFADGKGTLTLADSPQFSGQIRGFGPNSRLDLTDLSASLTSFSYTQGQGGGVLALTDGSHRANIAFSGSYSGASFMISADKSGGSLVSLRG